MGGHVQSQLDLPYGLKLFYAKKENMPDIYISNVLITPTLTSNVFNTSLGRKYKSE